MSQTQDEFIVSSYDQDLATFARLRGNLFHLLGEIRQRPDLFSPRPGPDSTLLRPDIRREILSLWYPLLDNYRALDALGEKHMGFYQLKNKEENRRAFHLAEVSFSPSIASPWKSFLC
ncbi:MAG: hypothetical protein R2940_02530 [Syntrophotaleaceae bacterium]